MVLMLIHTQNSLQKCKEKAGALSVLWHQNGNTGVDFDH